MLEFWVSVYLSSCSFWPSQRCIEALLLPCKELCYGQSHAWGPAQLCKGGGSGTLWWWLRMWCLLRLVFLQYPPCCYANKTHTCSLEANFTSLKSKGILNGWAGKLVWLGFLLWTSILITIHHDVSLYYIWPFIVML